MVERGRGGTKGNARGRRVKGRFSANTVLQRAVHDPVIEIVFLR